MPPFKPRVFIDADVLFAGSFAASQYGASEVVLRMSEITLVEALTSEQVITEVERNLSHKAPAALASFRFLVHRCLRVVPDPAPDAVKVYAGCADPKDLPIMVAALREACPYLLTFNVRHFEPGDPALSVLQPGAFLARVRGQLSNL